MMDAMNFPLVIREAMPETCDLDNALSAMGEDEFRAFYERTARPLWAYLSRITGDSQKADDFLQEAYYRFLRAGRQHESESHRRNSLFQIATNVARDAARRGRRYSEVPFAVDDSGPGTIPASQSPTPEHEVAMKTDVARAMSQLDPAQRELLWLAYAQGTSHEEIAQILGLKAISVRTLLFRARKKLAVLLQGSPA